MITTVRAFQSNEPAPPNPTPPPPEKQDVEFSYNSQDQAVLQHGTTTVHGVEIGPDGRPSTDKAELKDNLAQTDNGNFVFEGCDPRATAAVSFAAVAKTISTFEQALGQPITWAFSSPKLGVYSDDGEDLNAYYARDLESVHFFHAQDPITGATVLSGASGEVASHEAGHAILDGLRPGYFWSWTPDVGAFHESFGDMIGMLMAMQDDRAVARAVVQTGGDLSKPNVLANLGEQLGIGINNYVGQSVTGGDYVRTAINKFKWADPATLPEPSGPDELGSEVHDFSRLWTGAFYDILVAINQENLDKGMAPADAIKATGAEGMQLLANLMKTAPQGDFTYREMAEAFIASDNGQRSCLIGRVMTERGILPAAPPPEPPPAPEPPPTDPEPPPPGETSSIFTSTAAGRKPLSDVTRLIELRLQGSDYGQFSGAKVETLVDSNGSILKDAETAQRTRAAMKKLIADGRIRMTDPSEQLSFPKDYFDAKGRPYIGIVRWDNGEMVIERNKIAT